MSFWSDQRLFSIPAVLATFRTYLGSLAYRPHSSVDRNTSSAQRYINLRRGATIWRCTRYFLVNLSLTNFFLSS
ncbi:hypothetical protein GGX14DRAFT_204146 [Mycena pura]|uniref:Uncharacterized protein n=1 Tax=Mycena pura TaxID=153505 RepID=A0AAD6VRW9_9AGAR|nr:hypothetical protein GGX14DRAFT_204146 [Mycena pura]